jgi:uncharacterized protein YecE (DUF72 family)
MGEVRVGTASWTDKTLIESGWYPPEADTPEKRLRYYGRQFGLVEVDATKTGKERIYVKDLEPAVTDQAWERFLSALEPLRQAGKLGAILLQFPFWFPISRARKEYIVACAEKAAPRRVCVEGARETHVLFNNCYRDYAQANARQLAALPRT